MPDGDPAGRVRRPGPPSPLGTGSLDDPTAALYTVGQVADLLGVQPAFLRRLDAEAMVSPSRSAGGQRRYSRDEIGQVERVSSLMGEGMTLASIRRIVVLEAEVARLREELAVATAVGQAATSSVSSIRRRGQKRDVPQQT